MLRDIALGRLPDLTGKVVVVVGGGDTAMDAARSAWRLGAKEVHIVYRRDRDQMPAIKEEIRGAEDEGVQLHVLQTPVAVLGEDHVTGVRLQRQRLGDFDKSGRRSPVPMPGSEFDMPCDVLVPAIGQVTWVDDEAVTLYRSASFKVGKAFELGVPGVFAAGDAVTGPATVVQAVAHGNQVALVVDHWLQTGELGGVYYHPQAPRHPAALQPGRLRRGPPARPADAVARPAAQPARLPRGGAGLRRAHHPGGVQALPALRPGLAGEDGAGAHRAGGADSSRASRR